MPDAILGVEDRTVNNIDTNLDLIGLHSSRVVGRRDNLKIKLCYMLDGRKSCEEKENGVGQRGFMGGGKGGHM